MTGFIYILIYIQEHLINSQIKNIGIRCCYLNIEQSPRLEHTIFYKVASGDPALEK